jgi:hypothetical protein
VIIAPNGAVLKPLRLVGGDTATTAYPPFHPLLPGLKVGAYSTPENGGMPIGRIMRGSGVPHDQQQWTWRCDVDGRPTRGGTGTARQRAGAKTPIKTTHWWITPVAGK